MIKRMNVLLIGCVAVGMASANPLTTGGDVLAGEIECKGTFGRHLQGVASDADSIYWSFTVDLVKTDFAGNVLKVAKVPKHHGDICEHGGVIYCAVNLGRFNQEPGQSKSVVMSYDAKTLDHLKDWPVPELVHGAGGMTWADGRFYVIGGTPSTHERNYVYEYDEDFRFVARHDLETGSTFMGIQTAAFDRGRLLFGVYGWKGNPPGILVCDKEMKGFLRSTVNGSVGMTRLNGRFYVARTEADARGNNAKGWLVPADEPGAANEFRPLRNGGKVVVATSLRATLKGCPFRDTGFRRGADSYRPLYVIDEPYCPVGAFPSNSVIDAVAVGIPGAPSSEELVRAVRRAASENEVLSVVVADAASAASALGAVRREAAALGVTIETVSETAAVPAATHWPKVTMGRDYWTLLSSGRFSDPAYDDQLTGAWDNPAIRALPVFRDCALIYHLNRPAPDPATGKATWRTVRENCSPKEWEALEANVKADKPKAVVFAGKRGFSSPVTLGGEIDLDLDDYAAWKKRHPNLVAVRTLCEWGNDIMLAWKRIPNVKDEVRRKEIESFFAGFRPDDRQDRLALARKYVDRMLALNYGDLDLFSAFRASYDIDHIGAAWGAKSLTVEMTSTTGKGDAEYRWNTAAMFCRGAARQFGLPWCWYSAIYANAYGKDGMWLANSTCKYMKQAGNGRPEGGISPSLENRAWFWAYLNGANAVEQEGWQNHFLTLGSGRVELTDRGQLFAAYHDFTAAHPDRGAPYAPIAVLVPFGQGHRSVCDCAWGKCRLTPGDRAVEGVFLTLVPNRARAEALKRGEEGGILPSPYPMAFDVLTPDSPQPQADFAAALSAYPVAVIAGDFDESVNFAGTLAAWEKAGGRLLRVNAANLSELPAKLAGLVSDLYPVSLSGDVVWGLNRTRKGWWLWCFNNRGIVKFADAYQEVDPAGARTVTVDLKRLAVRQVRELVSGTDVKISGNGFSFTVAPGSPAVFELTEK